MLFKNNFYGIKTKVGSFLSFAILATIIVIIIDTFNKYSEEKHLKLNFPDLYSMHPQSNITVTMSYPKFVKDFARWINNEGRIFSLNEYVMKECNDSDFKRYFPNLDRDPNRIYICAHFDKYSDNFLRWITLEPCDTINKNPSYERARDPTCNKTYNNLKELTAILYNKNLTSFNIFYTSYNFSTNNYTHHNDSYITNNKAEVTYYRFFYYSYSNIIDDNKIFNNIRKIHSNEIKEIQEYKQHSFRSSLFEFHIYNNPENIYETVIFRKKLNTIIAILLSLFHILLFGFKIILTPYTNYCYKLQILTNFFKQNDYEKIISKLNNNKSIALKERSFEEMKSECIKNYQLTTYAWSFLYMPINLSEVDSAINEKISLERFIIKDKEKYMTYMNLNKKSSFLSRFDLLSNNSYIRFNSKSSYSSFFHYTITFLSGSIFMFIFISLGKNFYDKENLLNYKDFSSIKYNEKTNKFYNNIVRLNIPSNVYESFKVVKLIKGIYEKMPHWNCTNKQLKDIFNITSNSENRTNICMKFFDILNDIYNTKILDHELHVINCSDAPHLFNINDCKNTVAQNENIDIELEIENPSIIETSNYIRKGSVKNTLLTGLNTNRGHFNTLINFMKTIDDYETVDSLEIQGFHFKYHQVLSSRLTLFSWLIRFSNSYQILVDKRRSNFLQYFSISNGYYSIIMIGINLLTYTLLEYLYFKKALFTSINKSNNQIIEKSINELNNQSIANLNNIKNTENQNDVVNLKLYIENPNKIEEQNKINSKKLANINFFNYIKFKLGKLNKVKDDLFISLIKNISYFSLISNKKELNSMQQNSFIENFDYLSEKKNFFLMDNNFSTKTSFGGFLTIAIICTFIPMIYFLNTDYFKRENPKIRSNIVDSDLAISISKFSIDYNMTIYLDDDLYKNTIAWSNNFKYANSTDLELCKNNNFNNSGDKKIFCDEVTNDVQLAKRYVITHKCKLEKYVEYNQCPSNKYKFGFNLTYPTYKDITKLNDGLIIKSLSNEFETDVNNFPFYQVNFENIVAKENTGLIFDDYKEYNFNNVLFEEINENNVLSSVDSIEIYINSNTLNIEKYLKFKNFNEFLIESFSFLTILVDLGIILANFLSEYKYLKKLLVIYEIKTNSEEKLEIGFIDYCLDYIFLSSKKYDQDVDKLNSLVSIENLIED